MEWAASKTSTDYDEGMRMFSLPVDR
jgi:hypothetical protein